MKWRHLLWPGDVTRIRQNLHRWKEIVSRSLGVDLRDPLDVFGFIDGTNREICKPIGPFIRQLAVWDGHHNMPALGYLGLNSPDGLFVLFNGPYVGWVNDHTMMMLTRLSEMLTDGWYLDGQQGLVYGDLGFHRGPGILTGVRENEKGRERGINHVMNSDRVSVEWGFGGVVNQFRMHSFTPLQKPLLSRIAIWYLDSVLLTNCQICMYGSEAAGHFDCQPPSLSEYLRSQWDEDPLFAEAFDRYRPDIYPMRLAHEKLTKWNTGKWEWEAMKALVRERVLLKLGITEGDGSGDEPMEDSDEDSEGDIWVEASEECA